MTFWSSPPETIISAQARDLEDALDKRRSSEDENQKLKHAISDLNAQLQLAEKECALMNAEVAAGLGMHFFFKNMVMGVTH